MGIERDRRFQNTLASWLRPGHLIIADALAVDYQQLAQQHLGGRPFWLVSNLPYQIAGPLMVKFFSLPPVQAMTLMMQKEVAQKIHPPGGSKRPASSLSALANSYFTIKKLASVSPGAFHPPPQVESTVLSFRRLSRPNIALAQFRPLEQFVRRLFAYRRKQLATVLSPHYGRQQVTARLQQLNRPATIRAEELSLAQVHTLFQYLHCAGEYGG